MPPLKTPPPDSAITVGVSSCLLGEAVRYDGRDKRHDWICEELARVFELRSICPEVAIGLGVPRAPIRLVGEGGGTRARGVDDPALDVTEALDRHAADVARRLGDVLSGYVFKRGSPSCGTRDVPRYDAGGRLLGSGAGIFAGGLARRLPHLPVEEEEGLAGPDARANFIERVKVYRRWQDLCAAGPSQAALVEFHSRHKLLLLARDEAGYRQLGRLVGEGSNEEIRETAAGYIELMTCVMRNAPSAGGHVNALQHAAGFLGDVLSPAERGELAASIEAFRLGRAPLEAPLAAIRAQLARHPQPFLERQYYLIG